ncbi:hypothetical protein NKG05_13065 [Oerskovia sp. M15]
MIDALGVGPVDILASSGGAVNALALVAEHPEQVRTLVAHEPPSGPALPDREAALAATEAVSETYQKQGFGAGWRSSSPSRAGRAVPRRRHRAADSRPHRLRVPRRRRRVPRRCPAGTEPHHLHPLRARLRGAHRGLDPRGSRGGDESGQQMAARAARAIAKSLGTEAVAFPSNHGGFMGDEYGMPGDPEGFAAALRTVLDGDGSD